MVLLEVHGDKSLLNEDQFRGLKKCHEKFDCLVYEMLLIKELRPRLNTQGDSISSKLFVQLVAKFPFLFMTNCFSCIYRLFIVSFFFHLIMTLGMKINHVVGHLLLQKLQKARNTTFVLTGYFPTLALYLLSISDYHKTKITYQIIGIC